MCHPIWLISTRELRMRRQAATERIRHQTDVCGTMRSDISKNISQYCQHVTVLQLLVKQ